MIGAEGLSLLLGIFTSVCILILVLINLFDKWYQLKVLGILTKRVKYLEERVTELELEIEKKGN
jgi:hypothetical protein